MFLLIKKNLRNLIDLNKNMEKSVAYAPLNTKLIDKFLSYSDEDLMSKTIRTAELVDFSILDASDADFSYIKDVLTTMNFSCMKESKAIASFVGAAIGDSMGAPLEAKPYNPAGYNVKGFEDLQENYRILKGQWTDDTSEALCVADSLLVKDLAFDPLDLRSRFFLWWFCGYNNGRKNQNDQEKRKSMGIGTYTLKGLVAFLRDRQPFVEKKPEKEQTNSNGSIMRIAPIPIAFHWNLDVGLKFAGEQSFCTHDGEEASELCRLLTWIAVKGLNHPEKGFKTCKEILDALGQEFHSDVVSVKCLAKSQKETDFSKYIGVFANNSIEDRNWNWKDPGFKYSEFRIELKKNLIAIYSMDCVAMALHILYHNEGFHNCLMKGVNLGGDADSLGGVIGMLAGTFYGFNEEFQKNYQYIQKWDENEIAVKAYKLLKLRK